MKFTVTNIKTALSATIGKSVGFADYCSRMAKLPELIKMLQDCNGFWWEFDYMTAVVPTASLTTYYQGKPQTTEGESVLCDRFTMIHDNGLYVFWLPLHNEVYTHIRQILEPAYTGEVEQPEIIEAEAINTITTTGEIVEKLQLAALNVSKDSLRPAMCEVCVTIEKNSIEIAGTDAHKLYVSAPIAGTGNDTQLLIPVSAIKQLPKKGNSLQPLTIRILSENKGQILFEGKCITFDICSYIFPQYRQVIPDYTTCMEFDNKQMRENIKFVMPAANRTTNQVNFHLNGSIALNCCDVDFELESTATIPYFSKDFADMDIAFNGKLLTAVLKNIPDKKVKMYSSGNNKRAAIFKGSNGDFTLLMPLMIGC